MDSLVVSMTQFHGGSAMNVIPGEVMITGTVRSLTAEVRAHAEQRVREIVAGHGAAFGMEVELDYDKSYPPTVNHMAQAEFAAGIAEEITGQVIMDRDPQMGAEDFSYMLEKRPGAYLNLGQGIGAAVHHPAFDFNDEAAPIGASFFARLIETRHPV